MNNFVKIVLTGGPCSGKSEALIYLNKELEKLGFDVITVGEAASAVIEQGVDRCNAYEFQKAVALTQIEKEKQAELSVQNLENPVIICDRGLMDCRVYLEDDDYNSIKSFLHMDEIDMRDRYDAVFHLESTAGYDNTLYEHNNRRIEDIKTAEKLNSLSLKAWCGNHHYRFIPVCKTFDEKLNLLLKEVKSFLGVPTHLEIERKFLIKYPDTDYLLSLNCAKVEIEQYYMNDENGQFRLRKRGANGNYVYMQTIKRKISETVREEEETRLSKDEFEKLLSSAEIVGSLKKDRYCLMYDGVYYEIDIFPFWKKQAYVEVELCDENDKISIPQFLTVIEEVTQKPEYKNYSLCMNIPPEK